MLSPALATDLFRQPGQFETLTEKISVRHLNFYYGDEIALKDVAVPIYANKVTAIVGPSGCGKSTLLRVFNRIYDLYADQRAEGEVRLDGENILAATQDHNLLRTRIGMVFQKPTPFPMSIYDNIAFGAGFCRQLSRADLAARVEAELRRAALWDEVKDKRARHQPMFIEEEIGAILRRLVSQPAPLGGIRPGSSRISGSSPRKPAAAMLPRRGHPW